MCSDGRTGLERSENLTGTLQSWLVHASPAFPNSSGLGIIAAVPVATPSARIAPVEYETTMSPLRILGIFS